MIFVQGYIWNKDSHLNAKPIVDYIGYKDTLIAIDTNIIAISSYWKYYYTTKHDNNIMQMKHMLILMNHIQC